MRSAALFFKSFFKGDGYEKDIFFFTFLINAVLHYGPDKRLTLKRAKKSQTKIVVEYKTSINNFCDCEIMNCKVWEGQKTISWQNYK